MYYVYIHTNKINNKKYCGYTNNCKRRWRNNGIEYRPPKGGTERHFWNAIVKYGWDNFKHEVVFETKDLEVALEKEKEIIDNLNLRNRNYGYNIAEGGNGGKIYINHPKGMLGKPQTKYSIECSRQRFAENNPMYNGVVWNVTHPHPKGFKGHKHSEEIKLRISEKLKGRTFSEERNKRISEKLKGRTFSEEHKQNLSKTRKETGVAKGGKNPSARKIEVAYPNGEVEVLSCTKDFKEKFNVSQTTFDKIVKSNKPYELPKGLTQERKEVLSKLVGITIKYI